MRITPITREQNSVPVFKNIVYGLRLGFKCDKNLFLGYLLSQIMANIFSMYLQNILFLKILLEVIDGNANFGTYVKYLVAFVAFSSLILIAEWTGARMHQFATKKVLKIINNMIFKKANSLDVSCFEDPAFYDKYQRAVLVVTNSYFDMICYDAADLLSGIVSLVFVVGTVAAINPVYLLFLLPTVFAFAVDTAKSKCVYKRDLSMTSNNRIKAYIQRTVFLKDYAKDLRTSNIFAVLMNRFKAAIDSNIMILKKYGVALFAYTMLITLLSEFIPIIGTYAFAGRELLHGALTVSSFSVVVSAVNSVRSSMYHVVESFDELTQIALYFQNLKDFFAYEPKIVSGDKKAGAFESIEFKNVSFKYPSSDKYTLKNISFKLTKGETLAVVGVNGAGKSTLVKLILRFYDATDGEVLFNGVNVKEYDVDSLRNAFGTVFQDYKNFALSVYENVMCRDCDDDDKKKARTALERAGVWDKISSFKDGGDTLLTREFDENGAGLSGGENQKVSTARLFAKDFDIAILDEPSSALDPVAEYKMYENLIDVTKDKTVLYISHRLSSAVLSDRIIVLHGGEIVESGSHSELMRSGGEYSKMFALQASSYKVEAM